MGRSETEYRMLREAQQKRVSAAAKITRAAAHTDNESELNELGRAYRKAQSAGMVVYSLPDAPEDWGNSDAARALRENLNGIIHDVETTADFWAASDMGNAFDTRTLRLDAAAELMTAARILLDPVRMGA